MQEMHVGERIGWVVITAAALGVGMLLGGRACAPQDTLPSDRVSSDAGIASADGNTGTSAKDNLISPDQCPDAKICPEPKVIYECPPEPEPEKKDGKGKAKPIKPQDKSLPEAEPEFDPRDRQRLLAWVRDQSDDLKRCRDDSKEIYRVAVIMYLDKKSGKVTRVDVNSTRGETPPNLPGCLKQRILRWKPPEELVQGRTQLVFGLNI